MTVYVDPAVWPFGRMLMCHMIADSREELFEMVDKIGVRREWIQQPGTPDEHFDISKGKRALAIKHGAVPVDARQMLKLIKAKRRGNPMNKSDYPDYVKLLAEGGEQVPDPEGRQEPLQRPPPIPCPGRGEDREGRG